MIILCNKLYHLLLLEANMEYKKLEYKYKWKLFKNFEIHLINTIFYKI